MTLKQAKKAALLRGLWFLVPALTYLKNGLQAVRWNRPLLPKLLLIMAFVAAVESKLGFPSRVLGGLEAEQVGEA